MKKVYCADNIVDAQLVLDQLKVFHIEARIEGYQLTGAMGELPANISPSVVVLKDSDYLEARAIVEDFLQDMSHKVQSWHCPNCGELQEGTFHQCWNCGYVLEVDEQNEAEELFLKNKGLSLRLAKNTDTEAINQLSLRISQEFSFSDLMDGKDELQDIESNYFKIGGSFWVIENKNKDIIATVAVSPIVDSDTVLLSRLFVDAHYRKQGIGKFLLLTAIHWARIEAFKIIRLFTSTRMEDAIKLYGSTDFREVANASNSENCDRTFEKIIN